MKYTNPNGSIHLSLKKQHHDLLISIANTGEGISPEHVDRIFARFYRMDPARVRTHGGHGLGLAIAKAIIEQHKGKISVQSVPNDKTTF
ncbi:ATP-binding protein, partial [Acinetobacter baumannii]